MCTSRNGLNSQTWPLPFCKITSSYDKAVTKSKLFCPILRYRRSGSDKIGSTRIRSSSYKPASLRCLHRAHVYTMQISSQSTVVCFTHSATFPLLVTLSGRPTLLNRSLTSKKKGDLIRKPEQRGETPINYWDISVSLAVASHCSYGGFKSRYPDAKRLFTLESCVLD
jgi:hypothetical protein